VAAAWALVVLEFVLAIVLGMKRPGATAVHVYLYGPIALAALALLVGAAGLVTSWLRRPFARPQRLIALCVLGFVIASATYPLPFPSARSSHPSSVRMRFPATGEWTTAWGGESDESRLLRTRPDRGFGFSFVLAQDGATRADPARPESAFAFGAEVVAPAAGRVARVEDALDDDGRPHAHDLGNHVVLEVAPGEFLFVTGLQRGSIQVRAGDDLAAGAALGRIGFSAWSPLLPEPHLALHVQDTPDPIFGQGIPFYFFESAIDGQRTTRAAPVGRGYFPGRAPAGQRIEHRP
jgi:hypothetical protein